MKKFLITLLILCLVGGAAYFVWDSGLIHYILRDHLTGLEYEFYEDYYIVVGAGSYKESSTIVIPSKHLGKSVREIDEFAFAESKNLESVTISDNVAYIGEGAFAGCQNLKNVTINSGKLHTIEKKAFAFCSSLTSITLPNSVDSIGEGAFGGCNNLESMTLSLDFTFVRSEEIFFPHGDPMLGIDFYTQTDYYPFGFIFGTDSYPGSVRIVQTSYRVLPERLFPDKDIIVDLDPETSTSSHIASYYIPESLTSLTITGYHEFYGNELESFSTLTHLVIDGNLHKFGRTLTGCDNIESIRITDRVTRTDIGALSFWQYLPSLTNIIVDSENPMYYSDGNCLIERESKNLIFGCNSSVIPQGVTSIGKNAFCRCEELKNVTIPESVTNIGARAFYDCDSLTSITIPDSVTSISEYAFENCSSLTSITFDGTMKQWDAITKEGWDVFSDIIYVVCSDGVVTLN